MGRVPLARVTMVCKAYIPTSRIKMAVGLPASFPKAAPSRPAGTGAFVPGLIRADHWPDTGLGLAGLVALWRREPPGQSGTEGPPWCMLANTHHPTPSSRPRWPGRAGMRAGAVPHTAHNDEHSAPIQTGASWAVAPLTEITLKTPLSPSTRNKCGHIHRYPFEGAIRATSIWRPLSLLTKHPIQLPLVLI